ncbi:MAG TPA: acyl-ACP--UDP-N-acetylglucosamine O-acyltransferase [Gemmataceae bacterium]|nr:acyl-ACP--UDP-N-acetylglucosamine O-acyltransferase [Gemmataceae bacterium]
MSHPPSARIHPTAIIAPEAEIAENVEVGPYVVIEGRVRIGPDCVLRPGVHLCGALTMGRGNLVYTGAILGERPQHLRYNGEPTGLEIGEHNIFREHVTVHRGTTHSWVTRIGSHNFFMAGSHVAHDCVIGNRCILANGALVGGHCILEDNVYLSGNSAVHQFVRIGRLALLSGCSATSKDIPPFIVQQDVNTVVGINLIGLRRSGMDNGQINAVRQAFRILFREGLTLAAALQRLEQEFGAVPAVTELITFLRQCPRGINSTRARTASEAA